MLSASSTKVVLCCVLVGCTLAYLPSLFVRCVRGLSVMASSVGHLDAGVFSVAYVTAPSEDVAKQLARKLVTEKLAACVNIVPKVISVYEWENKIEEDNELLLVIKTRTNRMDELSAFVRKNHPYDVPEVIAMPVVKGSESYLEWLGNIVAEKK